VYHRVSFGTYLGFLVYGSLFATGTGTIEGRAGCLIVVRTYVLHAFTLIDSIDFERNVELQV
jgi:hypothetical protein